MTFLFVFSPTHASHIDYQGERIKITRNEYGIPFILAPSRRSFLYAYGWALAEDRPFQISFRQLIANGRLSEIVGEQALPMDKFMREINIRSWGERLASRLKV
jgi:penicillin amidase